MTQARFNQQQIEILNHHGHGKDFHWKSRSSVITHLSSMSVDFAIFPLSFLPLYIRLLSLHYPITFSFSFFLPPLFSSLGRFIVLSLDTKDGFPPTALWSKTEKKTQKKFTVSRAREWVKCASKVSRAEQAKEWAVQRNEQMDERVAQYFRLDSWLFWTIVHWWKDK